MGQWYSALSFTTDVCMCVSAAATLVANFRVRRDVTVFTVKPYIHAHRALVIASRDEKKKKKKKKKEEAGPS